MLDFCSDKTGKKKSEIIRLGIKKVYEELVKD
nr:MAG TPA: DNA-binding protein [Caudoviricetes sp.]